MMERSRFDLDRGVDTDGTIRFSEFKADEEIAKQGFWYQPTQPKAIVDAMAFFREDPKDFDFIDFGSGKGRILIGAAEEGFRSVTGVEFVPELVAIARNNLKILGLGRVTVHQCDAAQFALPDGDVVVYFGNPFRPPMMAKVLENIRRAKRKKLYVIYKVPSCAEILNECGFLEALGELPGWPGAYGVQTWRAMA